MHLKPSIRHRRLDLETLQKRVHHEFIECIAENRVRKLQLLREQLSVGAKSAQRVPFCCNHAFASVPKEKPRLSHDV
jgi:hypothetical protein